MWGPRAQPPAPESSAAPAGVRCPLRRACAPRAPLAGRKAGPSPPWRADARAASCPRCLSGPPPGPLWEGGGARPGRTARLWVAGQGSTAGAGPPAAAGERHARSTAARPRACNCPDPPLRRPPIVLVAEKNLMVAQVREGAGERIRRGSPTASAQALAARRAPRRASRGSMCPSRSPSGTPRTRPGASRYGA